MGSQVKRVIGKKAYMYYVYYDQGVRKEMYCGDVGKPESHKKALKYEIEDFTKKKKLIAEKLESLKADLREIR